MVLYVGTFLTNRSFLYFHNTSTSVIHDVDHPGVSNLQLATENDEMALLYKNKSVAEQNSIDFAWRLLMKDSYDDLRACIFATPAELKRFRLLLVNSVMATDVFDPDLKALRDSRWEMAFAPSGDDPGATKEQQLDNAVGDNEAIDLKATIVIEHIIQAADVAHTMQHWQ
jgi:3'5'-cyclic nucleotide phosphodiesterase